MIATIVLSIFMIIFLQTLVFFWYLRSDNPTVVDVGWALTTTLIGVIELGGKDLLMASLIVLWGLRLGIFLYVTRILRKKVDERYVHLAQHAVDKKWYFFKNFQLQGVLIYFLTMPTRLVFLPQPLTVNLWIALATLCAVLGLIIEFVADMQLHTFKERGQKGLCTEGLWNHSRHPNYFGDWLFWLGFSLIPISTANSITGISLISPLILILIMTQVTGPLTEQLSLKKRPAAYKKYQKSVPMFFPRIFIAKK